MLPDIQPVKKSFRGDVEERFWANVARRFWSKVLVARDDTSCWLWGGALLDGGYGKVTIEGKTYRAHVVSFELSKGPVTPGLYVLHSCDRRICVRPDHLFEGTQKQNIQDAYDRGRITQTKSVAADTAAKIAA